MSGNSDRSARSALPDFSSRVASSRRFASSVGSGAAGAFVSAPPARTLSAIASAWSRSATSQNEAVGRVSSSRYFFAHSSRLPGASRNSRPRPAIRAEASENEACDLSYAGAIKDCGERSCTAPSVCAHSWSRTDVSLCSRRWRESCSRSAEESRLSDALIASISAAENIPRSTMYRSNKPAMPSWSCVAEKRSCAETNPITQATPSPLSSAMSCSIATLRFADEPARFHGRADSSSSRTPNCASSTALAWSSCSWMCWFQRGVCAR